jgi:hypothetical protein
MRTVSDEIQQLEKSVDALQSEVEAHFGKFDDPADNGDITEAEAAELEAEVDGLEKDLNSAIAKVSEASWNDKVRQVVQDQNVPVHIAMQKCRKMFPDDYARYQQSGIDVQKSGPAMDRIHGPDLLGPARALRAQDAFNEIVSGIARERKLPRHVAMAKARLENDDLYKAMQGE